MRRISAIFVVASVLALCTSGVCSAQVRDSSLTAKGASIWMDGVKMKSADLEVLGGFDYRTYRRGRVSYVTGLTMVCVGVVPATLSGILIGDIVKNTRQGAKGIVPGVFEGTLLVITGAATIALEAAGIPMICVGLERIKKTAKRYNEGAAPRVTVVPSVSCVTLDGNMQPTAGVTLAVRF